MNLRLLIDGIVRQTTVLIAQLSTTSGVRSPLAQLADQVFLQLTRELESQGVTHVVAADMFGMALRVYQKKIARIAGWGDATALVEDQAGDSVGAYASINDHAQACVVWQQVAQSTPGNILFVRAKDLLP